MEEKLLVEHLADLDNRFYGLTLQQMRSLVYEFADRNHIPHPFNREVRMAGIDWTRSFRQRHGLSLRTPQKTSIARIAGFNKMQVDLFFDNLWDLQLKYEFTPNQIFNVDETGLSTVPNKIPKVLSKTGKRAVGKAVSAERGSLISIIAAFSASGVFVPPALIFPRKREKLELLDGAPPGSVMYNTETGYSNGDIFLKWLQHFKNFVHPTENNCILLLLDNHVSHISLAAIDYCRDNFIIMLTIPPHSSQKLQPCDRAFFGTLKNAFGRHSDVWIGNHPGRVITHYQIAGIFRSAYLQTATMSCAVEAFSMCGICPYNREIFNELDFLPSSVTDQMSDVEELPDDPPEPCTDDKILQKDVEVPLRSGTLDDQLKNPYGDGIPLNEAVAPLPANAEASNEESAVIPLPRLEDARLVSPRDILSIPKIQGKRQRRAKGAKSTILTSSPVKARLLAESEKREQEAKQKENSKRIKEEKKKEKEKQKNKVEKGKKKRKAEDTDRSKKKAVRKSATSEFNPTIFTRRPPAEPIPEPEAFCLICGDAFSNSRSREKWIQCNMCCKWAHSECTDYNNVGFYVCDDCRSM